MMGRGDRRLEAGLRRVDRAVAASRRRRRAPREPRRDPNYPQLPAQAGTAIEAGEIERWRRRLGAGWEVIPRTQFGSRYGLARAFRGAGRPDLVAVNRRTRSVLVGDITAQPSADHVAKTVAYAQRLAAQLPPELAGFGVLAQEWYWGLPPEWGRRGSWPTSRRIRVA
jgi:hypothetical protein